MPAHYGSRKYDPLGIDPDALRYIAQSGARDRNNINRFVRGVKSLGLWSSMVCWPLRSSQNAGTGTTAFSLGGLGSFPGTLVNGPTWGVNGLTFVNASSQRVVIFGAPRSIEPNSSFFAVGAASEVVASRSLFSSATFGGAGGGGFNMNQSAISSGRTCDMVDSSAGSIFSQFTSAATAGVFQSSGLTSRSGDHRWFLDGSQQGTTVNSASTIGTNVSTTWMIGAQCTDSTGNGASRYYDGTASFAMGLSSAVSVSVFLTLRRLYRDTLGQGLGLP